MDEEGLNLAEIAGLLVSAAPSGERRKHGIEEFIARRHRRSYKIVLAESLQYSTGEVVWLVIHLKGIHAP